MKLFTPWNDQLKQLGERKHKKRFGLKIFP